MAQIKDVKTDLSNERLWAVFCYFPVLNPIVCLVAAVRMVGSELVRFHARQGLMVFALLIAVMIVSFFTYSLAWLLNGLILVVTIYGAYLAYHGEKKMPVLGDLALKIEEFWLYKKLTGHDPDKDLL